jgi:hypothetical protein
VVGGSRVNGFLLGFFSLERGTDRLSRNVGKAFIFSSLLLDMFRVMLYTYEEEIMKMLKHTVYSRYTLQKKILSDDSPCMKHVAISVLLNN